MRLTLRNLLNYIDGVLPPDEMQEIGKRVQESEFAASLCLRIRDCMRRLRLAAPSVNERGSGLDPNTVAEYLDHALSDARVQDFERVCLESDVQLAEVASCHQILTAILGGPAETDPASIERMCHIPALLAAGELTAQEPASDDGIEAPPVVAPVAAPPVEGESASSRPAWTPAAREPATRRYVGVPGESSPWLRRMWQGLALAAIAAAIVVIAVIQFPDSTVARFFSHGDEQAESAPGEETSDVAAPKSKPPVGDGAADGARRARPPARNGEELAPAKIIPLDEGPGPGKDAGKPAAVKVPAIPPGDQAAPPAKSKAGPPEPPDDEEPGVPAAPQSDPKVAAQFVGDSQVALRIEPRDNQGYRMADLRLLQPGDQIVALPGSRPEFMMPGKLRVTLVGPSRMSLLPAGAGGYFGIETTRGRLLAHAETPEGAALYLRASEVVGLLTLSEESLVALEVARLENPGLDPETQPGPLAVDLYVLSGKATWRAAGEPKARELKSPLRLALSDRPGQPTALRQRPRWVADSSSDPLEQHAAATIERALLRDKAVRLKLHELTRLRQKEVSWLARQCLALLDDYEPMVEPFRSPEQKALRSDCIAELKAAVMSGPKSAAAVRTALEATYGADGAELYPLLWKYGPQIPGRQGMTELIGLLENPSLSVREFAFWNLRTLTGQNHGYRPDDPAPRRQAAVQRWRDKSGANAPAKTGGKTREDDMGDLPAPLKTAPKPKSAPPPPRPEPPVDDAAS